MCYGDRSFENCCIVFGAWFTLNGNIETMIILFILITIKSLFSNKISIDTYIAQVNYNIFAACFVFCVWQSFIFSFETHYHTSVGQYAYSIIESHFKRQSDGIRDGKNCTEALASCRLLSCVSVRTPPSKKSNRATIFHSTNDITKYDTHDSATTRRMRRVDSSCI